MILKLRQHKMLVLRQMRGILGFCNRMESVYDSFVAGNSSTCILAAQGITLAKSTLNKRWNSCITFIRDDAITGGGDVRGYDICGYLQSCMIFVIINNRQVSLPIGTLLVGGDILTYQLSTPISYWPTRPIF